MGGAAGEGAQVHLHAANNLWEVRRLHTNRGRKLTVFLAHSWLGSRNWIRCVGIC